MEITVRTKEDFERACKEKPQKIIIEGEMADKIQKSIKVKKAAKIAGFGGGALAVVGIIAGIVAAPVTMGASLGATVAGAAGLTIGGGVLVMSTVELAIVAGVIVSGLGVSLVLAKDVLKNYDIKIGNHLVELIRKN